MQCPRKSNSSFNGIKTKQFISEMTWDDHLIHSKCLLKKFTYLNESFDKDQVKLHEWHLALWKFYQYPTILYIKCVCYLPGFGSHVLSSHFDLESINLNIKDVLAMVIMSWIDQESGHKCSNWNSGFLSITKVKYFRASI